MKFTLFILLCTITFSLSGVAQSVPKKKSQFTLKGKITDKDTGCIIIHYPDASDNWINDTTELRKGRFYFTGNINEPTFARLNFSDYDLRFGDMNAAKFFLEPTEMSLQATAKSLNNAEVRGSKVQNTYKKFLLQEIDIQTKYQPMFVGSSRLLRALFEARKDSAKSQLIKDSLKLLSPESEAYTQQKENLQLKFIADHPNTYVSAFLLTSFRKRPALDFEKTIYNGFSEEIKKSGWGKYIKDDIEKRSLVIVGAIAPDISIATPEGKKISLSDLKGKLVLLDFWASWCVPCRQEIPELKSLYEQYHSKGLEIVTISIDRKESDWKKALEEEHIPQFYNILFNDEITKKYENVFLPIPSQILVNRDGVISWKRGYEEQTANKNLKTVLDQDLGK